MLFHKFFINQFTHPDITPIRLFNYASDHLARTRVNNPGNVFDPLISATTPLLATARQINLSYHQSRGQRKASSLGKRLAVDNWLKEIGTMRHLVAYKFKRHSGTYKEFYPQGMKWFHRIAKRDMIDRANLLGSVLSKYAAQFPPQVVADYQTAHQQLKAAFGTRNQKNGQTVAGREALKVAIKGLQIQLTANVLTIALHFVDKPEKAKIYFDQSLLMPRNKEGRETFVDG